MKQRVKELLLSALIITILTAVGCSKDDGGGGKDPVNDGKEVSLYEARKWDGEKRADIFYEIFVHSFADSNGDGIGDLRGITDKLAYLNDMGISGIWLTPIHPSPSYHGYDVADYRAIRKEYGTMADFEAMMRKANELKIKVVLDLVINHSSKTHPYFVDATKSEQSEYRNWFLFGKASTLSSDIAAGRVPMTKTYEAGQWHSVSTASEDRYMGMFSDWMPEINYGAVEQCENSPTFIDMCEVAKFWLDKGVAGFRLDAVKHIYQDEDSDENPEFLRKFYTTLQQYKSDIYMVGEVLGGHNQVVNYYKGLPAYFEFQGWWNLDYAINNNHAKWYPMDLINFANAYKGVREDFIQATKLSNHDEERTRSVFGGNMNKTKLAAAVLLTVEGSPYIYYGEEIGMTGMKQYGDEGVREPFLWDVIGKDSYRTRWRAPQYSTDANVTNQKTQKGNSTSIWRLYEKFIELRNTYPALAHGKMELPEGFNSSDDSNKHLMIFYRTAGAERLYVIHNVSHNNSTYQIPESVVKPIADFGGVQAKREGERYTVVMPPYTTIIFEM